MVGVPCADTASNCSDSRYSWVIRRMILLTRWTASMVPTSATAQMMNSPARIAKMLRRVMSPRRDCERTGAVTFSELEVDECMRLVRSEQDYGQNTAQCNSNALEMRTALKQILISRSFEEEVQHKKWQRECDQEFCSCQIRRLPAPMSKSSNKC